MNPMNITPEHREKVIAEFNKIKSEIEKQTPIRQSDNLAEKAALAADRAAVEAILKAGASIEQVLSGEYTVFIQHITDSAPNKVPVVKFIATCVLIESLNNISDANETGGEND